jgi:hypothetical protein
VFVSDGTVMITLWQASDPAHAVPFDRKNVIGLHHLALLVESQQALDVLHARLAATRDVRIEFAPEPLRGGPVRHMMCATPGGAPRVHRDRVMSAPPGPFHDGELRVQARLGVDQQMAAVGPRVIRDHLLEQHRDFFAAQHMLLLVRIDALPVAGAPHGALTSGERIGLLGIDYATRRRNRLNGRITSIDDRGFELRVEQHGSMPTPCRFDGASSSSLPRWTAPPANGR